MKEIWKDIKGYEGIYQVSNLGNIKSLNRISCQNHKLKEKIRIPKHDKYGYLNIKLHKDGKSINFKVHRLVAQAFIPNLLNLPQVNHKNENEKDNNRVDNLEWCTEKYNVNYGTRTERSTSKTSIPIYQYSLDGKFIKKWSSLDECKKEGFRICCISECCNGRQKTHKGFKWSHDSI